jgi:hypothetical protein
VDELEMSKIITREPKTELRYVYAKDPAHAIRNLFCGDSGRAFSVDGTNGPIFSSGLRISFCDGHTTSLGDTSGLPNQRDFITSIVDPLFLHPLRFLTKENVIVSWDDAWELATEEERAVLIQWMNLR